MTVNLRALEPEDLEILYQWENDPDIWQAGHTLTPFSRYVLKQYLENSHLDIYQTKQLRFIIELIDQSGNGKRPIGTIDLFDFEPFHNRAGVGILIASEDDRKKGYGSHALKQLIDYCFSTLCLHQLFCNIETNNKASLELFKKQGFEIAGMKKDWNKTSDGYADEYLLQLVHAKD
jgi:diamine N-acetyltransferase